MNVRKNEAEEKWGKTESADEREIRVKEKIVLYGKKKKITHFKVQMKDEVNTGSTH